MGRLKLYCHKTPVLKDVDIEKLLVSNKIFFGEENCKYFIGYLDNDNKVNPLHITLPKTSAYIKRYDGQTKWMYECLLVYEVTFCNTKNGCWKQAESCFHLKLSSFCFHAFVSSNPLMVYWLFKST